LADRHGIIAVTVVYAVIDVDGNTARPFKVRERRTLTALVRRRRDHARPRRFARLVADASLPAVGEGTQVKVEQYRHNGQLALESPEK
jgi:transposase